MDDIIVARPESPAASKGDSFAGKEWGFDYIEPRAPEILAISELPFDSFTIPYYQRPYKWTHKNVNQLIDDILCFKESGEYRLGTLVLHSMKNSDKDSCLDIVDGQQRIITLSLILYELMKSEKYSMLFSEGFQSSVTCFLGRTKSDNVQTRNNLLANLRTIRHRLVDFTKETVSFLLDKCRLLVITLFDISEAFQFFDSQNARGKELSPHDLLKGFHLRAIKVMDEKDRDNIVTWEKYPTNKLESLFLMLYRVKRWVKAQEARYFTSQNIDTFKGVNSDDVFPYQKIYTMAQCYLKFFNQYIAPCSDGKNFAYPHQIDHVTINGSLFFDMARHYWEKVEALEKITSETNPEVMKAVNSLNRGQGDRYIRLLFDAACLFYYDKFGNHNFKGAMDRIFAWAYGTRLRAYSIKLATIDNLARGQESFFSMLHDAVTPNAVLNWPVPVLKKSAISENQKADYEVINLMEKLGYVE